MKERLSFSSYYCAYSLHTKIFSIGKVAEKLKNRKNKKSIKKNNERNSRARLVFCPFVPSLFSSGIIEVNCDEKKKLKHSFIRCIVCSVGCKNFIELYHSLGGLTILFGRRNFQVEVKIGTNEGHLQLSQQHFYGRSD